MEGSSARGWARGGTVFAATMMLIIGIYQIFLGIAAIAQDNFFFVSPNYAYEIDTTAWGWIHLGIGVLAVLGGAYLYTGQLWARIIGVLFATISAVANFFFLPYYPLWSLLIIALDIFVIWAIASYGRRSAEVAPGAYSGAGAQGVPYGQEGQRWATTNPAAATAGRHWAGDQSRQAPETAAGAGVPDPSTTRAGWPTGSSGSNPSEPPTRPQP